MKILNLYQQIIVRMRMRVLVRKICLEKRLSKDETATIMAVIECESGFNPKAVNVNVNKTTDYGICQWNDYWSWKREQIIHPDEALNNPEKAIRLMIDYFKRGQLHRWCCYKYGLYRRHLDKFS